MEFKEFKEFTYEECKNLGINQQNRLVDKSHCRSIRQQMVKYIDIMPPVVINEKTNNIIDGQHRIEAFKYLVENDMIDKNSVIRAQIVSVDPEEEINVIIDANTHSKSWAISNYVECYYKGGNENYIKLVKWCLDHELTFTGKTNPKPKYRYGFAIIKGEKDNGTLKNGSLVIEDWELEEADQTYLELVSLFKLLKLSTSGSHVEPLFISWNRAKKGIDYYNVTFDEWVEAIEQTKFPRLTQSLREFDAYFKDVAEQLRLNIRNKLIENE